MAGDSQHGARARALSIQLAQAHAHLRDQLADARNSLDDPQHLDASELTHHCLAFCQALLTHHRGEDCGLFAELLRQRPELEPAIGKLAEDHQLIGGLIDRVHVLLTEARTAETAEQRIALGRELDGLAASMASHFAYEERAISDALDRSVVDTAWAQQVFDPRAT